jgi:putative ABC transport system substrate-binding protein
VDAPLTSEDNAEQVLYELISKSVDLVYLPSDSYIISKAKDLIPVLTKHKIPTYGAVEALIKNGAMVGVVSSYYAVGRGLAKMAKAVLNGKSPAEIPAVRLPLSMQTILVNDHTVSQLGLAVPDDIVRIAKVMK